MFTRSITYFGIRTVVEFKLKVDISPSLLLRRCARGMAAALCAAANFLVYGPFWRYVRVSRGPLSLSLSVGQETLLRELKSLLMPLRLEPPCEGATNCKRVPSILPLETEPQYMTLLLKLEGILASGGNTEI